MSGVITDRFDGESLSHYETRMERHAEFQERAARQIENAPLDMHNDVTEGQDVYKLVEEAFYKGKTQGYGEGLRQGQVNSNDTIEFFKRELTQRIQRETKFTLGYAVALVGTGVAMALGTMLAIGLL